MKHSLTRWNVVAGPFQNSIVSLSGMMLCIFAAALSFVSISTDQTGTAVAFVSQSFEESLRPPMPFAAIDAPSDKQTGQAESFGSTRLIRFASARKTIANLSPSKNSRRQDEESETDENATEPSPALQDEDNFVDTTYQFGFAHFVKELNRFRETGALRYSTTSPSIDFYFARNSTVETHVAELVTFVTSVHEELNQSRSSASTVRFRINLWSVSPAYSVLSATAADAQRLEHLIRQQLTDGNLDDIQIVVESSAWMHSEIPRPEFSVQVDVEILSPPRSF